MANSSTFLSVVIPVFQEDGSLESLISELISVLDSLSITYELIFVDDGSTDKTKDTLMRLGHDDSRIKALFLGRNVGQTAALVAGISAVRGEIVVLMDGDLQNDPADIPKLLLKIQEGYDVVSGWRKHRHYNVITRTIPSWVANKLISFVSGVVLHDYGCTLKAYRGSIIKDLELYGEMHRFIPIYSSWRGAKIIEVEVNHRVRKFGKSKYSLSRTLKVILDLITIQFMAHYRTKPIYVFGGSGIMFMSLSFLCIAELVYNKFMKGISMIQSPLLVLSSMLFIVGFQCLLIGLLAEMQMRSHFESVKKTIYYVKERMNIV